MIKKIVGKVWKIMPYRMRIKVVRSVQKKFTVSVVAIVTNEKNEILILDHYFRPGASWGLPGGFIDPYEQAENGIRREIKEETDLELENLSLLKVRTIGKHLEILFIAEGVGKAKVNSQEIKELGWFALDNLPENMGETQLEWIDTYLQKQ